MMKIIFGPAGLGGADEAIKNLEGFHKLGLGACEIAFTYGIYLNEKQAIEIGKSAEKNKINISIHAPYWINLNSDEKIKVEQCKNRIIACCKIGHLLGAQKIVFHPGYYGKRTKEESYENIKKEIILIQEEIKINKWNVKLAPETTGRLNVFGSIEEILNLVKDTKCSFTIDFAHLLARSNGKMSFEEMSKAFANFKELHCHFSGIEYGEKGEKRHISTKREQLKELLKVLIKREGRAVIINESPNPVEDSVFGTELLEENG